MKRFRAFFTVAAIAAGLLCMFGCRTVEYITIPTEHTDTLYITKQQRDSIYMHDSIYMYEYHQGDTTYILRDRWHTKYIERATHDTTYVATHDTIPQPYPVEVEVPAQLSAWQRFRLSLGNVMLYALLIMAGMWLWRLWRK